MTENQLIINPKTRVLQLIEAYPQLEEILIEYIPAFKKLNNPVLRKTVAKVATIQQAASIGKVKVEDLINHLRREVGQDLINVELGNIYNTTEPEWFKSDLVQHEFDIREMLAAGEHPVNQVISDLKKLDKGMIYKIVAPFLPAPLIDKAISLNFEHWIEELKDNLFHIYFCKTI